MNPGEPRRLIRESHREGGHPGANGKGDSGATRQFAYDVGIGAAGVAEVTSRIGEGREEKGNVGAGVEDLDGAAVAVRAGRGVP